MSIGLRKIVDQTWTDLVYQGLWHEPLREELELLIRSMNKWVTGSVRVKVFGGLTVLGRVSPYASYSRELVDYVGGWYPSEEEARGFIKIHTMHSLTAFRVRRGVSK